MSYAVNFLPAFRDSVNEITNYLFDEGVSVERVSDWLERLTIAAESLEFLPERCPVDESQTRRTGRMTRKMNFGDYLIYYQVFKKENRVDVVGFRHGAKEE